MLNYLKLFVIFLYSAAIQCADIRHEPIQPLPLHQPDLNLKLVDLGDRLFHDTRLSQDGTISCASCHVLSAGGTDRLPVSVGVGGIKGGIKAPTVYNSGFNFTQFWDGRADTLEEQAAGPVHNPIEMNSNWHEVIAKLRRDPDMVMSFEAIFDDGITPQNIVVSIAEFERSLVTANSRFDRWLKGDDSALTDFELSGYRLFKSYGCISCHQGKNVGGNLFAYMGAMGDYFKERKKEITPADLGRFNVTGKEEDKHFFKVPSLRLAAINPPYFHDSSVETLTEAVQVMGRYQLGRDIPAEDVKAMVAFLNTLVGEHRRLKP
ncbi:MAG: cytochrome B6 [Candidatus Thiodiazotropha sp. (ex Monitilora ramsayi)]|nr:cytochrome B6 [Candidatus Thiodiazotropha sp. (ex Monitilora ramsayi)]